MSTGHIRHFIEHYLAPHPSGEVKELFISTAILDFATASVMVFEPIYLYSLKFSLQEILLFYLAVYALYFFLLPIGGRICRQHGFEHSMLYSSPFLILYYLSFFGIGMSHVFIYVAVAALAIQKVLYWPSYHSNFASWAGPGETGREVSNMSALAALTSAIAPAVGGALVVFVGFKALFVVVAALILISNVPLLRTPECFEPKPFAYGQALARLFRRENRRSFLTFLAYGEELVALVLWPIFIVLIIPNYLTLGAIISLAMIANVIVTLYVGRLNDEGGGSAVLKSGVFYTAGAWLARLLVVGGLGVFLIDSFYRVAKNLIGVPLTALMYDDARRRGATERVVFFEMALSVGKMLAAGFGILILEFFPGNWNLIFIMAFGFTLLFALMRPSADLTK